MSSSCECSADSTPKCKSPCCSHVSVYYEQDQKGTEPAGPKCTGSCLSERNISECPAVEICEEETTCIDLPPLIWHGYDKCPKVLTVTNTGRTISINGHWTNSRPYIEGGPLNGTYLFSQIHFHCPSEHEINGRRYPLEMHIVHYKTSYLTQERAMQEKDGTVVLVYLFQSMKTGETVLSQITRLAPVLQEVNSRTECAEIPFDKLIQPFMSNYYVYWGSIATKKNCYLLQWIVNCNLLSVSVQEVEDLSNIINCVVGVKVQKTPRVIPEYDAIYHVGEADYSLPPLRLLSSKEVCKGPVPYFDCKCRLMKVAPTGTDSVGKIESLLVCDCPSNTSVSRSTCDWRWDRRKCSKCKKVELPCDNPCLARKGLVIVKRVASRKTKKKKKTKCRAKSKDKSGSGSLISCVCNITRKKVKKCRKKKPRKTIKSCECQSEKSSSKSSVCSEKVEVQDCESEVEEPCEEDNKKEECIEVKIVNKGNKKKKEVKVVESAYSLKGGPSKSSMKASTELSLSGLNLSGLDLLNSNFSANGDEKAQELETEPKSEVTKKNFGGPEPTKESNCDLGEGKKEMTSPDDVNSKSPVGTRRSRSKSRTNVQKARDPESAEGKATDSATRQSKSKSPDVLKRKISLKKDRERSNSKSKSKALKSDSKSKIPRSKKVAESTKSAQEVKYPTMTSTVQVDNMKCDTIQSEDMKAKSNRLRKKESSKIKRPKSKGAAKGKNKADGEGPKKTEDDDITTIFEKKQNGKRVQSLTGDGNDVNVNFLLTQGNASSPSCAQTTSESDFTEEKKACDDLNENWSHFDGKFTVNTATILEPQFSGNKLKEESQGCYLMEHVFRTDHRGKACECSSQEFHLAIMYDQCILQEYRGTFHPQELQLGDSQMLTLLPLYPEPKYSNFRLQDCFIKRESVDQICIRVKFMLKDLNVLHIFANTESRFNRTSEKKEKSLFDQQTQINSEELCPPKSCELKSIEQSESNIKIANRWPIEILTSELKSDNKEKQSNKSENKVKQRKKSEKEEKQTKQSKSKGNQKQRSKSKESQKLRSESEERQNLQSESQVNQILQSETRVNQALQSEGYEKQNLQLKGKENRKPRSKSKESQKLRSESEERQNLQSESQVNQILQSETRENLALQSEGYEKQNLQSKGKENRKPRSKSKESQKLQSENAEKQKLQLENNERHNIQSENQENQKMQSGSQVSQKIETESNERQKLPSESEENKKLPSKSKERQKLRSKSKECQNLQIESQNNPKPDSEGKQKLPLESLDNQKLETESKEKQKLRSKSKECQNLQIESQSNQKLQSDSEEKLELLSESQDNSKLQPENGENQNLQSKSEEMRKLQSESQDNQKLQSDSEEKLELLSESQDNSKLQPENGENQNLQSKSEEMRELQSESRDNQKLQSDSEEKQKLPSEDPNNEKLQSDSEDKQTFPSESQNVSKMQSESEEKQMLGSEGQDNPKLQSENGENQKVQSQCEEMQKLEPESQDDQILPAKSVEIQEPKERASENLEEQLTPSKSKDSQNLQPGSEEDEKLGSKREEKGERGEEEQSGPQTSAVKPERVSDVCSQDAQPSVAEQTCADSRRKKGETGTSCSEQEEKKLKSLFVKRRKTVYFIYEKVEKDESTGKKVFVGSFKTKEEIETLKKQKASPQENEAVGSSGKSGKTSEVRRRTESKVGKLEESSDLNSPSIDQDDSKKDIVTMRKYKPGHSKASRLKKECENLSIEKDVDDAQEHGPSSANLGQIASAHKGRASKVFVYQPQGKNLVLVGGKSEKQGKAENSDAAKSGDDHSGSEGREGEPEDIP